jgi:hypothetical protein
MDYKQESEKIVEMFRPYAYTKDDRDYTHPSKRYNAVRCAIKHVEGILLKLDKLYNDTFDESFTTFMRGKIEKEISDNEGILNQLKQM